MATTRGDMKRGKAAEEAEWKLMLANALAPGELTNSGPKFKVLQLEMKYVLFPLLFKQVCYFHVFAR